MFKTIKNQKGITLVELLAVMVIVGIIAAISIPAIGNLIENTRQDAFISTAKNVTEAARLAVAQNTEVCDDANGCIINFVTSTALAEPTVEVVNGEEYIENLAATTAKVTYSGTTTKAYTIEIADARYSYGPGKDAFKAVRASATAGEKITVLSAPTR